MANLLPAGITNLVKRGAPVRVASPLGPVMIVGKVDATTCDVFVDGEAPEQHDLADLVLDVDNNSGADRAVRWAQQEHAVRLYRIRKKPALLVEQCLRLAGDPALPSLEFPTLPGMDTIWDDWLPGGPTAPTDYDVRIAAHRDVVLRWIAAKLSVAISSGPPGFYWGGADATNRLWVVETDQDAASFRRTGLSFRSSPTVNDGRYRVIGAVVDGNDDGRALAIVALQIGIVQFPTNPNVETWVTRRDVLLGEITPEP